MLKIKKGHIYHLISTVFLYCVYLWIMENSVEDIWSRTGCFLFILFFNVILGVGWSDSYSSFYKDFYLAEKVNKETNIYCKAKSCANKPFNYKDCSCHNFCKYDDIQFDTDLG